MFGKTVWKLSELQKMSQQLRLKDPWMSENQDTVSRDNNSQNIWD